MPNWCNNFYAFYVKDEDKGDLARLHKNLVEVMQTPSEVKNDFEPGWLGKVAIKHGFDYEEISCRGYIRELEDYRPGDSFFTLSSETAWSPTNELWKAVIEQYTGIAFVYTAEEPGCELYINTDVEGVYFSDRYLMDIYGDAPIPEGWYHDQDKPATLEIHEYFESFDKLKEYCSKLTGKSFSTFEELRDYFETVFDNEPDVLVGVHEYSTE